jgi:hypothetical protein
MADQSLPSSGSKFRGPLLPCAVVASVFAGIISANAQTSGDSFTAAALYTACTHSAPDANTEADHEYLEQLCTTYFRGLTDALFVMQSLADKGTRTCMPVSEPIGIQQARVVFEGFLQSHPNAAKNSAGIVSAMAQVYAHKCSGGN